MTEQVFSPQPVIRSDDAAALGRALFPVNHRDAIRARDPLTRLGGLALEFVSSVVPAPMALFLLVTGDGRYSLAEIKVDSMVTPDPVALERDCVAAIEAGPPLPQLPGGAGRHLVMDRAALDRDLAFAERPFAAQFMPAWGLGPILSMVLRPLDPEATCVVTLLRLTGQSDFTEREKGFMRHWAPLLVQSLECVIDTGSGGHTSHPKPNGRATDSARLVLTRRELEIARQVAAGARNEEIADSLTITVGTVKSHVRSIYSKLGVHSRVHLALLLADR